MIVLRRVGVGLAFLLAALLTINTWTYLNFDFTYGFLRLKQHAISTGWYLQAYYAHIFAGGAILLIGFIQFSKTLQQRYNRVHKLLGRIYGYGILLFAAPGGMIMSFFIGRGQLVTIGFIVQCTLWIWFTAAGVRYAVRNEIFLHRQFMIRSFALTLAAITLRVYIFGASYFIDLTQPWAYAAIAWLSWLPNLIVAEVICRKKIT